jgi:hypothetical protein
LFSHLVWAFLIYSLFGRDWKAFSKQSRLLMQDLEPNAQPLLTGLLSRQHEAIRQLEKKGPLHGKLMMRVSERDWCSPWNNKPALISCMLAAGMPLYDMPCRIRGRGVP